MKGKQSRLRSFLKAALIIFLALIVLVPLAVYSIMAMGFPPIVGNLAAAQVIRKYAAQVYPEWEPEGIWAGYNLVDDGYYLNFSDGEETYTLGSAWPEDRVKDTAREEELLAQAEVERAIVQNPDAKAVLVNNPTYYGICSDLKSIVELAHAHGMLCLADEAHGTHFYFHEDLPMSAMEAGADMAAVSMHKSGGSLTQSSLLLTGPNMSPGHVRQIINLTQTTSASYLLLSSLDIARRNLALRGREEFGRVMQMADYARQEINAIGGYYAFSKELINGDSVYDFDITKLSVNTLNIGLAGIEVYDLLRDEYDIQIEFGDLGNILAYLSIGDRPREIERLVSSLSEVRRRFGKSSSAGLMKQEYIDPEVVVSPQKAFYAPKESLPLEETVGRVCSEFVMCYPPGIPILTPGERITQDIIAYILYAKEKGCSMTGPEDPNITCLNVLDLKED